MPPLTVTALSRRTETTLLMPAAHAYRPVIALILLLALLASSWGAAGWGAMDAARWAALTFGGLVALMLLLPRSWQPWRLAELGWDERHLYLLCPSRDLALALPRSALYGVCLERQLGHQGEWLGFALDLTLDEAQLAEALALLQLGREQAYEVSPGIYRFAFRRAWHSQRALKRVLAPLQEG